MRIKWRHSRQMLFTCHVWSMFQQTKGRRETNQKAVSGDLNWGYVNGWLQAVGSPLVDYRSPCGTPCCDKGSCHSRLHASPGLIDGIRHGPRSFLPSCRSTKIANMAGPEISSLWSGGISCIIWDISIPKLDERFCFTGNQVLIGLNHSSSVAPNAAS